MLSGYHIIDRGDYRNPRRWLVRLHASPLYDHDTQQYYLSNAAWVEHHDDPNFPEVVKVKVEYFLSGDSSTLENYDALLEEMKIGTLLSRILCLINPLILRLVVSHRGCLDPILISLP